MPPHSNNKTKADPKAEDETVLLPNDPAFQQHSLAWTDLFELTRLFQALSHEEQKEVNFRDWARLASKADNPDGIYNAVLANKKLRYFDRIASSVKTLFEKTNKAELPVLEKRIGYNLILDCPEKEKSVTIHLTPPTLCKPNELNRTYGANNFLVAKMTDRLCKSLRKQVTTKRTVIQKAFEEFVNTPVRIADRLFLFILRKEQMLLFVSTGSSPWLSTRKFFNSILDLKLNRGMTVAKWVARTTLVLSATQSTIDIDPQDIRKVPDLYSDSLIISRQLLSSVAETLGLNYIPSCIQGRIRNELFVWRLGVPHESDKYLIQLWDDQIGRSTNHVFIKFQVQKWDLSARKFVSHEDSTIVQVQTCLAMGVRGKSEIMTDGAGLISRAAASRICENLGRRYEVLPAAYQARIAFAKGLWILDPDNNPCDITSWIEVRDSQWKAEPAGDYHYHFNLCRMSRAPASSTLGKQLLPLLASRGVKTSTICQALEEYIQRTISDLNTKDPIRVVAALTRCASLTYQRRISLSRMLNIAHDPFVNRKFKEEVLSLHPNSDYYESWEITADRLDKMSLNPCNPEEQVVSMLASGFETSNRYIVGKLRKIKEDRIRNAIKFKIPISQSAFVYVIPDPTGTLKEGEVFLQLSDFRDFYTGIKISTIVSPALISRSPCVAPIDVRKVKMVHNEILCDTYFDVLVCSIQGTTSLLSLLSGGDYDGDQATVIWDPVIVEEFRNADVNSCPRIDVEDYFNAVQVGTVNKALLGLYENHAKTFVIAAQSIQIAGLFACNDQGCFSSKHTMAEYVLGADHPLTQKLGEVYVKCLDAPKAGMVLKPEKKILLKEEFETALAKVKHPNGGKAISFNDTSWIIPRFLGEDPKFSMGGRARVFRFARGGRTHILDALLGSGYALLKKYKEEIDVKDCLTHTQRSHDRDHDLSQFFIEQKKLYEFDKTVEGSEYIWKGVLRPLQRALADLLMDFGKSITFHHDLRTQDELWESEYGLGASGSKYERFAFKVKRKYFAMSYDEAFDFTPETEDIERYKIDLDKFKSHTKMYLEGLGPMGYALLKASCLAMCSNPEAFAPYELAFREICYLKAVASQTKRKSGMTANYFSKEATMDSMPHRPPRSITTESYLTNVIKLGIVQGRSTAQDRNRPI